MTFIQPHRKPWRIRTGNPGPDAWGIAKNRVGRGEIIIDPELRGKARLEVLLHEVWHACQWDLPEWMIKRFGEVAAEAVHAAGFREIPELSEF
jgi:hypothetical protein